MSFLVSSSPPISGAFVVKRYAGFGIRGADIPATGDNGGSPALNDGISADGEYYWRVVTPPSSGTLEIFPDLTFDHSGAADGSWPWVYELFSASGSLGQATVTDVFGTVSHEITISSAQQLNTVDSVAIQQTHLITASNSQQANQVSQVFVTQSDIAYVEISDSQQTNTVSSVAIQQVHCIGIANSVQRNTVSSVALQVSGSIGSISDADIARIVAAVLAALQATAIPVDAKKMNGAPIIGDGSESNRWRGVGVPN